MPQPATRALAVAFGVAGLLAALPQSAQGRWAGGIAAVVRAPLAPAVAGLSWVRDRVRVPQEPYAGLPEDLRSAREDAARLQGELDAARLRADDLGRQLAELTGYRAERNAGWRPMPASVVERGGGRPGGLLGLSVGGSQGIEGGDPVVVGGNQLLGRVAEGVDSARAWVVPLDQRASGRIDAVVHPAGAAGADAGRVPPPRGPRQAVLVQLTASEPRRLIGELETPSDGSIPEVRVGDVVLLSDSTWRPAAQGMRIGTVESVGRLDSNPLRSRVTVRMDVDPARAGRVVVKVRDRGTSSGGAP